MGVDRSYENSDSDDEGEQSGEELLKNLKLPPDITITRVKSADGKSSYNFRRNNASLCPSEPGSQKTGAERIYLLTFSFTSPNNL